MLFYEYNLKCTTKIDKKVAKSLRKDDKKAEMENTYIFALNKKLNDAKAELGLEHLGCYECNILGLNADKEFEFTLKLVAGNKPCAVKPENFDAKLAETVGRALQVHKVGMGWKEVVPNELNNKANNPFAISNRGMNFLQSLDLPSSTMGEFELAETYFEVDDNMQIEDALKEADELFLDERFKNEITRIFSCMNQRSFVAHPVHYLIELDKDCDKNKVINLLVKCLHRNKRLLSNRLDTFFDIEHEIEYVENFNSFLKMVQGSNVVLDTKEDEAGVSVETLEVLKKSISQIASNTLFIIVQYKCTKCFASDLVENLSGIDFVKMGSVSKLEQPINDALFLIAKQNGLGELFASNPPQIEERDYNKEEVAAIYNSWASKIAKEAYKAYSEEDFSTDTSCKKKNKYNATAELEKLIGLKGAKATAKELLAAAKVNKLRKEKGLSVENRALHMLFTGNPGSAKTTFARLVAKIMYENKIIKNDVFVECGRADLVGQYVGWTAKCVKQKFSEAKGGVLFIDEAYSLIGEGRDFGSEAISTIVQEMENHRDDVVVIFAGYPDKMEEFLKQNEGLRSRIPYHMHFPDYNEEELLKIMQLITAERGYELTKGFEAKCKEHLREAVKNKDFGNGRYMRNLFEKAVAKQAMRITESYATNKITKSMLVRLEAEDFPLVPSAPGHKLNPMGIKL